MDFGAPVFGLSKYKKQVILHRTENGIYIFSKNKESDSISHWSCLTCTTLKKGDPSKGPIPSIRISNGRLIDDPGHPIKAHFCTPQAASKVDNEQALRQKVLGVKTNGKRPRQAYTEYLAEAIKNKLISNHGSIGELSGGFAHMDFEDAVISAFGTVFPEMTVKGCRFHFMQALMKKVGELGLKAVYEQFVASGFHLPQYSCVKKYIRTLGSIQFLPPQLILRAFNDLLSTPPVTGNPVVDENLVKFGNYFKKQWMTDRMVGILCCYDHDGPRTTNHLEGINNAMRVKFDMQRPRLSLFLVSYKEIHHSNQVRIRQLLEGADPVARRPENIQKDAEIAQCRNEPYQNWISLVGHPDFTNFLNQLIIEYLHKCCRL